MRIDSRPRNRSSKTCPTTSALQPRASIGGTLFLPRACRRSGRERQRPCRQCSGPPRPRGKCSKVPRKGTAPTATTASCCPCGRYAGIGHPAAQRPPDGGRQIGKGASKIATFHAANGPNLLGVHRAAPGQLDNQVVAQHAPHRAIAPLGLALAGPQFAHDSQPAGGMPELPATFRHRSRPRASWISASQAAISSSHQPVRLSLASRCPSRSRAVPGGRRRPARIRSASLKGAGVANRCVFPLSAWRGREFWRRACHNWPDIPARSSPPRSVRQTAAVAGGRWPKG